MDDDEVRNLIPSISRPIVTYGVSEKAQIKASKLVHYLLIFLFQEN